VDTGQHDRGRHERVLYSQRHEEVVAHLMKAPVESDGGTGHGASGQHGRRHRQQPGRQRPPAADRRRRYGRCTVQVGDGGRNIVGE